jgi:site-specific DNA-methyltransferase (adenine-specific)
LKNIGISTWNDALLFNADCLEILKRFPGNYFDSVVTDPPYHLTSIVDRFGDPNAAPAMSAAQRRFAKTGGADRMPGSDQYGRLSTGFMGQTWDGGDIAFRPETWREVLRVLKPGGYMVAFGGSRTSHRIVCAIEDAGFEIRDTLMWIYGSGFPKSHDVSKAIDNHKFHEWLDAEPYRRAAYAFEMRSAPDAKERDEIDTKWRARAGLARPIVEEFDATYGMNKTRVEAGYRPNEVRPGARTGAASPEAAEWQGWGSALKPAFEPICLARKPLAGDTIAENVLEWRTGGINVDGCRVEAHGEQIPVFNTGGEFGVGAAYKTVARTGETRSNGRWPANVLTDGSAEVIELFPSTPFAGDHTRRNTGTDSVARGKHRPHVGRGHEPSANRRYTEQGASDFAALPGARRGDAGSAARFFYAAKASKADRAGSKHPTVKPISLKRWLVRLITPPGGLVLDPFAGSGTTGAAARLEGFRAVLIEQSPDYCEDIRRRLSC